jgi:hypothetical protein
MAVVGYAQVSTDGQTLAAQDGESPLTIPTGHPKAPPFVCQEPSPGVAPGKAARASPLRHTQPVRQCIRPAGLANRGDEKKCKGARAYRAPRMKEETCQYRIMK